MVEFAIVGALREPPAFSQPSFLFPPLGRRAVEMLVEISQRANMFTCLHAAESCNLCQVPPRRFSHLLSLAACSRGNVCEGETS